MNKHIKILFTILFIFISSSYVSFTVKAADDISDIVVCLQIDNPMMKINGVNVEIDQGRGTTPVVINNRTLVPIRAIIEAFGGNISWINETRSVVIAMEDEKLELFVDSKEAYLNGNLKSLDVAPSVINDRTMLPIRFVAESFNLSIAWDNDTKTVYIIKNEIDEKEYEFLNSILPYCGEAYAIVNENNPFFEDYEMISTSFEFYSSLDEYNRCGVAFASVGVEIMPTEDRESISSIYPTGWINARYEDINAGYLYNRCHLIGFQLTGENANERNLITGTRYLNMEGMLPFENMLDDYVEKTNNHVMYRVTPFFKDENLVASGVLLEAYSVEDMGEGITFCVFCYNVQPGIYINYATGENCINQEYSFTDTQINSDVQYVYRTPSGKKYHFSSECGGKNSYKTTMDKVMLDGLSACSKCVD